MASPVRRPWRAARTGGMTLRSGRSAGRYRGPAWDPAGRTIPSSTRLAEPVTRRGAAPVTFSSTWRWRRHRRSPIGSVHPHSPPADGGRTATWHRPAPPEEVTPWPQRHSNSPSSNRRTKTSSRDRQGPRPQGDEPDEEGRDHRLDPGDDRLVAHPSPRRPMAISRRAPTASIAAGQRIGRRNGNGSVVPASTPIERPPPVDADDRADAGADDQPEARRSARTASRSPSGRSSWPSDDDAASRQPMSPPPPPTRDRRHRRRSTEAASRRPVSGGAAASRTAAGRAGWRRRESRNRRRRRRRKGGRGPTGPQGDDAGFVEARRRVAAGQQRAGRGVRATSTCATRATASSASRATCQPGGLLHPGQAGPPVRAAQGRPHHRHQPPGRPQREEPGAARRAHGQRRRPRAAKRRPRFEDLTALFPDENLRLEDPADPDQHDGADHRPRVADRQGPARHHRVAAEGRQDDDHEDDRHVDRAATTPRSS